MLFMKINHLFLIFEVLFSITDTLEYLLEYNSCKKYLWTHSNTFFLNETLYFNEYNALLKNNEFHNMKYKLLIMLVQPII